MAFASLPEDHYRTSSLSHPANSPFGRSHSGAQSSRMQTTLHTHAAAPLRPISAAQPTGLAAIGYSNSPFAVKPELDPLEREKREVERRRARLDDRKTRILHAKTRVMGVDVDALNEQVRDRAERERLEQERDSYHSALTSYHAVTLTGLEEERKLQERIRKEELAAYRQQQADEKRTREQRWASGFGQQVDPGNGTFLAFTGEDLQRSSREKAQAAQQSDWLAQQLSIQAEREARERQDEADYAAHQARVAEMQKANEAERHAAHVARLRGVQEYNQQISAQKSQSRARASSANLASDRHELSSTLSSALLNERVDPSSLGANRSIPYHFKGFSAERRQQILDEQWQQTQALQEKRVRERAEEAEYARQSENVRREMLRQDRARDELERQRLMALKEERRNQHMQKTLRDQYHNKVVYTNPVAEAYFQQFGTSGR